MAESFHKILSRLRKEKKLSQRQAAADLGISQALLSHYENGVREPGLAFLAQAADYYGVSADYLQGRSACRLPPPVTEEELAELDRLLDSASKLLHGAMNHS